MDFRIVLKSLVEKFESSGLDYALIGGFALGLWGVGRATLDLDFLTLRRDLDAIHGLMHELGFECVYRTENVSQFISPLKLFGEVDFLHAFRVAAMRMLERAVRLPVFENAFKLKVLVPEDLIGLKVQAMKNDPERAAQDLADIHALLALHGRSLDWRLLEEYCDILNQQALFDEFSRYR